MLNIIIGILIGAGVIVAWLVIKTFIRRSYEIGMKTGINQVVKLIFEQVREKGKIEIELDKNKMTIVELKSN